jgi:tetratricopeptide (TPR) repeat protein
MEYRSDLPELQTKLDEIQAGRQANATEEQPDAFVDLMADLDEDELFGATDFLDEVVASDEPGEFTQELATELDSEDTESHYNLGIAYKEMGLFDDAIEEFNKASKDPKRQTDCLTLKGQCQAEAGDIESAEETFKSGLSIDALSGEARMTLHYELGMIYETSGRSLEALESYQVVADKDAFFRDVGEKVDALRKDLGLDGQSDNGDGPKGDRDRVSYV